MPPDLEIFIPILETVPDRDAVPMFTAGATTELVFPDAGDCGNEAVAGLSGIGDDKRATDADGDSSCES